MSSSDSDKGIPCDTTRTGEDPRIELCPRAIAILESHLARRESVERLPLRYRKPYIARHASVSWNLMLGKNPLWSPISTATGSRRC